MTSICSVGLDMIAILLILTIPHRVGHDCWWSGYQAQPENNSCSLFSYGKEGDMLELEVFFGMRR